MAAFHSTADQSVCVSWYRSFVPDLAQPLLRCGIEGTSEGQQSLDRIRKLREIARIDPGQQLAQRGDRSDGIATHDARLLANHRLKRSNDTASVPTPRSIRGRRRKLKSRSSTDPGFRSCVNEWNSFAVKRKLRLWTTLSTHLRADAGRGGP